MTKIHPVLPKFAVHELDEDDLTDIDDEVFIRDGKNGSLKLDDEGGVKRPLMTPRKRPRKFYKVQTHRLSFKTLFIPCCYGLVALMILLGLIILCIYTANIFPISLAMLKKWLSHEMKVIVPESRVIPCTSLVSKIIWTKSLPKLSSEAPLRSNDVNGDGVDDILIGFGTGLDEIDAPEYICNLYFKGQAPCKGGVLVLDGKTGEVIWTHWTSSAIFSIDCGLDVTNDKIKDCIAIGYNGVLHIINGQDGSSIWEIPDQDFSSSDKQKMLNIYDAKFIPDTDDDDIADIIATHTVQSDTFHFSEVLIISGKNGHIIHNINFPNMEELFIAPQVIVHPDGENLFVLTTTNQMESGGLYIASHANFIYGDLKLKKIHSSSSRKGIILPPILADVTLDGIADIIASMFNSTIIVYDGLNFNPIWNYTVLDSQITSMPIPGYYNDDDVPDFMVKHQIKKPGFSEYYYTSTVIDGRNGQPLLEEPIKDSLNRQMSGLSITVDGYGNDWFLHWSAYCLNYENTKGKRQILEDYSLLSQTYADLCRSKYNSTPTISLLALSQHVGPPGISLYSSGDPSFELNDMVNIEKEVKKSLKSYPNVPKTYKKYNGERRFTQIGKGGTSKKIDNYQLNSNLYKDHTEYNPEFQLSDTENLDADNVLRQKDNWITNINMQNKEYDTFYDNNDKDNTDEQNVDYLQVDELREQRSENNDKINNTKNYNKWLKIKKAGTVRNLKHKKNEKSKKNAESIYTSSREINEHIQRQPPTGILLPSLIESEERNSIDLVFPTVWLPLVENTLIQEDFDCIHRKKLLLKDTIYLKNVEDILAECLSQRGVNYEVYGNTVRQENPNIAFGQITVYRMRLECACPEDMLPNQVCKNIASHQSWPEDLGVSGSGYFRPLHRVNV